MLNEERTRKDWHQPLFGRDTVSCGFCPTKIKLRSVNIWRHKIATSSGCQRFAWRCCDIIPGYRVIPSNNTSRLTRWVREKRHMVGLWAFMNILIVVFKNEQETPVGWRCAGLLSVILLSAMSDFVFLGLLLCVGFLAARCSYTPVIERQEFLPVLASV